MDDAAISTTIENLLRPSNAKMFWFSYAGIKFRLDERGLTSLWYIQEADTFFALDNLVSYLPGGYSVPNPVKTWEEKLELCNKTVKG